MDSFGKEFTSAEEKAIDLQFQRVGDNTYLDHAGTTLYADSQIDGAGDVLKKNLFCNPHTCKLTGDLVDQVRYRILRHFNTDSTEYAVVFTANATAALKLVAECFDFGPNASKTGGFYYCQENHTSVLGMRDIVKTENIFVVTKDDIQKNLSSLQKCTHEGANSNSLLAFSAQCNFSGFKMPLDVIGSIQEFGLTTLGKQIRGTAGCIGDSNFYICLDTASYAASNFLDLRKYQPDFCCISFYKMFGYPTGVGCLLVSKRGQEVLHKRYYGGGTVKIAMTLQDFHEKRDTFTDRFEDGTLAFLTIPSLLDGFRTLERLVPARPSYLPMERIAIHVFSLAKYAYEALAKERHANGAPLIKFYNHCGFNRVQEQGGIVTFNVLNADGSYVGFAEVACIAAIHNVQMRTGCFCNPGACQWFLNLTDTEIRRQFASGHICSDYNDLIDGVPTGAVRMSFGYMTKWKDVQRAVSMIRDCYLTTAAQRLALIDESKLPKAMQHIPQRLRPKLKKISIYPVKSCGAFDADDWPLINSGLKYDRNWMIIDTNGRAMTQKNHTRMCLIRPLLNIAQGTLELHFPGMQYISVPLELSLNTCRRISSSFCQSKVCNDLVEGLDCGDAVGKWLTDCLEVDGLRLLKHNAERRTTEGIAKEMTLANQAQFLLVNRSSVRWLASKVETEREPLDITVDRFRANLIIETASPLEENDFDEISIGGVRLKVEGFCTRCQMICIDQHSGQKSNEPLRTIAREFNGKIRFGVYLSLREPVAEDTVLSCKDILVGFKKSTE